MGSKQNLPDPTPYADKPTTQATLEAGQEIGAPNTVRSTKGAPIMAGPCHEEQVTPRSPDPYANASNTQATDQSTQADVKGGRGTERATYKTNRDETGADDFGHGYSPDAIDPYGYGGDSRWS